MTEDRLFAVTGAIIKFLEYAEKTTENEKTNTEKDEGINEDRQ